MSTPAIDYRMPTEVTDDYWIHVCDPNENRIWEGVADGDVPPPDRGRYSGKWMLFIPLAYIDEMWTKVRNSTFAGELGTSAKTATMKPNANAQSDKVKVICVYTYDYRDLDDVRRVLKALRKLGNTRRLSYKSDAATYAGKYGNGSAIFVSQPDSLDFDDRRPE